MKKLTDGRTPSDGNTSHDPLGHSNIDFYARPFKCSC